VGWALLARERRVSSLCQVDRMKCISLYLSLSRSTNDTYAAPVQENGIGVIQKQTRAIGPKTRISNTHIPITIAYNYPQMRYAVSRIQAISVTERYSTPASSGHSHQGSIWKQSSKMKYPCSLLYFQSYQYHHTII